MDTQPHADREALETLQALALKFLNSDETSDQGETLWRLFCYLEDRLGRDAAGKGNPPDPQPEAQEIPDSVKEVIEKAGGQGVCVFLNCRIESVTAKEGG
jgi:hypothetical protein